MLTRVALNLARVTATSLSKRHNVLDAFVKRLINRFGFMCHVSSSHSSDVALWLQVLNDTASNKKQLM